MNLYYNERKCKEKKLLSLILGFRSIYYQKELLYVFKIKAMSENSVNVEEFGEVSDKKCKRF